VQGLTDVWRLDIITKGKIISITMEIWNSFSAGSVEMLSDNSNNSPPAVNKGRSQIAEGEAILNSIHKNFSLSLSETAGLFIIIFAEN